MKKWKVLIGAALALAASAVGAGAATARYAEIRPTGSLQPNTTGPWAIHVGSGTIDAFRADSATTTRINATSAVVSSTAAVGGLTNSGNTTLTGLLNVTGQATFAGGVNVTGGVLALQRTLSGSNVEMTIENLSNTASSGARQKIYSAGASAGDAFTTYSGDGGSSHFWSWGVDQSDSRAMVLSRGSAPGTSNAIRFDNTTGLALIPLLSATLGANLTGAGFKVTGISSATANGDAVNYEQWNNGRIRQIVAISTTGAGVQKTSTSGSYATTGLSGSVTISSSTSKVIALVMQTFGASGAASTVCTARVRRDSSDISTPGDYLVHANNSATESSAAAFLIGFDTPGAGTFTYSTQFSRYSGAGTCIANSTVGTNTGTGAYMLVIEVGQ